MTRSTAWEMTIARRCAAARWTDRGYRVRMTEVPVAASVEQTLAECLRQGLEIRSERELGGRPGSHHYHLALPGQAGTLELSEWQGKVWFSVNERRDCGWVSEFARATAATMSKL